MLRTSVSASTRRVNAGHRELGGNVVDLEDLVLVDGVEAGAFVLLGLDRVDFGRDVAGRRRGGDGPALDDGDAGVIKGIEGRRGKPHHGEEHGLQVGGRGEEPGDDAEAFSDSQNLVSRFGHRPPWYGHASQA